MHSLCNTWSYIILYETWFWHNNYQHITSISYSLFVLINMKTYFTLFVYIFTVSQACASPISKRKFMTSSHQILNSQFRISNLSDWSKVCFDAIKKLTSKSLIILNINANLIRILKFTNDLLYQVIMVERLKIWGQVGMWGT